MALAPSQACGSILHNKEAHTQHSQHRQRVACTAYAKAQHAQHPPKRSGQPARTRIATQCGAVAGATLSQKGT